jgi:ribA/ribD-fused uncharacterized protein
MQSLNNDKFRIYKKDECIVFSKTNEKFGGMSNMAPGYPLFVNDNIIPNSEVLYQAMRYPLFPDIQNEIISQNSPMTAKMISKKYLDKTRQDWELIKTKVMRWCLEVKLCQNWETFGQLLRETENKPIVEFSVKDKFWGASSLNDKELSGVNALGRLLMELREKYIHSNKSLQKVQPLNITGFLLYGYEIESIWNEAVYANDFGNELFMCRD